MQHEFQSHSSGDQQQIQRWFVETYSTLYNVAAQHLGFDDAEKVLDALSEQLPGCRAKDRRSFEQWAGELVNGAAKSMAQFRDLYVAHQALVFDAINKGLGPVFRRDSDFCRTVEPETGTLLVANETAQELAAETWIEVLKKLSKFRPTTGKVTTWIYRIAYLKAMNHKKKRTRRSKKESFLTVDDLAAKEQQSLTCSE